VGKTPTICRSFSKGNQPNIIYVGKGKIHGKIPLFSGNISIVNGKSRKFDSINIGVINIGYSQDFPFAKFDCQILRFSGQLLNIESLNGFLIGA
jgi:hypothetical protein